MHAVTNYKNVTILTVEDPLASYFVVVNSPEEARSALIERGLGTEYFTENERDTDLDVDGFRTSTVMAVIDEREKHNMPILPEDLVIIGIDPAAGSGVTGFTVAPNPTLHAGVMIEAADPATTEAPPADTLPLPPNAEVPEEAKQHGTPEGAGMNSPESQGEDGGEQGEDFILKSTGAGEPAVAQDSSDTTPPSDAPPPPSEGGDQKADEELPASGEAPGSTAPVGSTSDAPVPSGEMTDASVPPAPPETPKVIEPAPKPTAKAAKAAAAAAAKLEGSK